MYHRKSRLKSRQQSELMKLFVAGSTARAAAEIVGVNKNTVADYFESRPLRHLKPVISGFFVPSQNSRFIHDEFFLDYKASRR